VRYVYERPVAEVPTAELARILRACIRDAERAHIDSPQYVAALIGSGHTLEARALWQELAKRMAASPSRRLWQPVLSHILEHGPLARRLLGAAGRQPSRERLAAVYAKLCACLERGALFDPSI
jgi:carboxylate-amine ligase